MNGNLIGTFKTSGAIESSPTILNGTVFFGDNNSKSYAVNLTTRTLLWKFVTAGPIVATPVASSDGVVYVGSTDGNLYALRVRPENCFGNCLSGP